MSESEETQISLDIPASESSATSPTDTPKGRIVFIEVENFKSYLGRQTIGPFKNFTCIIGPNGSGKSNLMDAISFVMGLRAAFLRSSNVKQLIYNADGKQEQLGRSAYVKLVFEYTHNNETREIQFQRNISAQGQTDYRIQGRSVTAQEYENKLKEYGILTRARNFLVFQGDVESIAAKNPKDLSKLIEQVSASDEFKKDYEKKKEELDKASEMVHANIQKKKNMMSEKTKLKAQKAEATRYNEIIESIGEKKQELYLWQLYHIERDISILKREQSTIQKENADQISKQRSSETMLEDRKKRFLEIRKEQSQKQESLKEFDRKKQDTKTKYEETKVQIQHIETSISVNKKKLERRQQQLDTTQHDLQGLRKELEDTRRRQREFEEQAQREKTADLHLRDNQLEEYNRLKQQAGLETVNLKQELDRLRNQFNSSDENLRNVEKSIAQYNERRQQLSEQEEQFKQRIQKLKDNIEESTRNLETKRTELTRLQRLQTEREEKKQQTENQINEIKDKLKDARVERRENERERRFKDALESMKRLFSGVYGKLSDLCKVTRNKYLVAFNVALGKHAEAVVVENEKVAFECVNYLKEQHIPPVTFIPLETIKAKRINEKLRKIPNVKLALDVIQFSSSAATTAEVEEQEASETLKTSDEKLEKAFRYALGNTIICENLDEATRLCFRSAEFKSEKGFKAVTVDGTIVNKNGLMTGGLAAAQSRTTAAQTFTETELNRLKANRDKYLEDLQGIIRDEAQSQALVSTLQSDISTLENRVKFSRNDIELLDKKLDSITAELSEIGRRIDQETEQRDNLKNLIDTDLRPKIEDLLRQIRTIEDRIFRDFSRRVGIASISEYEEKKAKEQEENAKKRSEFAVLISRIENRIEVAQGKADSTGVLAKLQDTIKTDETNLTKLQTTLSKLEKDMKSLDTEGKKIQSSMQQTKKALEDLDVEIGELRKNLQTVLAENQHLQKQITAKENQIEQLRNRRLDLIRKCQLEAIDLPEKSTSEPSKKKSRRTKKDDDVMEDDGTEGPEIIRYSEQINVSQTQGSTAPPTAEEYITLDFESLDKKLIVKPNQPAQYKKIEQDFHSELQELENELQQLAPTVKGLERLQAANKRLEESMEEFEDSKNTLKEKTKDFEDVKKKRYDSFMKAFDPISDKIDRVYKDLTKSSNFPLGGTASLSLEDTDEPYMQGIKYSAMPPMKRYRTMELLSGGEKTVAALALLFAIHHYRPSPFFILDEIDAALDNANVQKVARYIRERANDDSANGCQFIVISLKETFYTQADSLIGIYRDSSQNCSKTLSLDLTRYTESKVKSTAGERQDE